MSGFKDDEVFRVLAQRRDATVRELVEYVERNKHRFARWPIGTKVYAFDTGRYEGEVVEHAVDWSPEEIVTVLTNVRGPQGYIVGCYPLQRESWDRVGTMEERAEWLRSELARSGNETGGF